MGSSHGDKYLATNCIYDVVSEWLNSNQTVGGDTIEYHGSYKSLLDNLIYHGERDEISVPRLDDYPDYRQVEKCVNENIRSYF